MTTTERVTISLPTELVESIDRVERNRDRFIVEAVEHELLRRRHEGLVVSIENPHSESAEVAETGLAGWVAGLPAEGENLVDVSAGRAVHWIDGKGWVEDHA